MRPTSDISLVDVRAMIVFQCLDTAGWDIGRTSSLWKAGDTCHKTFCSQTSGGRYPNGNWL